jgi:hypothetical protein
LVVRTDLNPDTTARDSAIPLATASGRLLAWTLAAYVCARTNVDPDLWGHVRFGLDTLASRRLTAIDPYSFTQDVPWINHEWLSEVLQALAYRAGGAYGLTVMKAGVLVVVFALLWAAARRTDEPYRWWSLAAGFAAMAPDGLTNRPQLWTLLGLAALWHALQHPASPTGLTGPTGLSSPTRPSRLFWLPVLFAVWANMHGGWIVGTGVATLWIAGRLIDTRSVRVVLPAAAALVVAVAATVINPYGWRLWWFLGSTVRMSRNISEWRPLWQQADASDLVLWLVISVGIVATTAIRRRGSLTWAAALPVAWLAVTSLLVTRLSPLFAEVAVLSFARSWQSASSAARARPARVRPAAFAMVDAMAVVLVAAPFVISQAQCLAIRGPWAPDLTAASAFASPFVHGRLVLPFDWGEYALWQFGPRLRVSMDGRRETVYSEQMVDLQSAAARGQPEGFEYLSRVRPEYVWLKLPAGAPTRAWLKANDYQIDVDTGQSFIGRRADLPPLAAGPPMSRCFP